VKGDIVGILTLTDFVSVLALRQSELKKV
jgi:hypothetical protein